MQIIVLADDTQRQEMSAIAGTGADIKWIDDLGHFEAYGDADVWLDLLFVADADRIAHLARFPKQVIVNSVVDTVNSLHPSFVRINGWGSFLLSPTIEAATLNEATKKAAEDAFAAFGKSLQWLPDEPGFITPRVVSMIINEAYLALGEGISTKAEINTAMKLGTAYPYGPFEWVEKIGEQNVVNLLQRLAQKEPKYTPAELLAQPIQL